MTSLGSFLISIVMSTAIAPLHWNQILRLLLSNHFYGLKQRYSVISNCGVLYSIKYTKNVVCCLSNHRVHSAHNAGVLLYAVWSL